MSSLPVYVLRDFEPRLVGELGSDGKVFTYDTAYVEKGGMPLSQSLPLRPEPYLAGELQPYFEGLLAEGAARESLVAELELPADDWVALLAACGRDCIGDVVIGEIDPNVSADYEPVPMSAVSELFSTSGEAAENAASRLSLAGTQHKTGLAHEPGKTMDDGWLRPRGLAATTHILKTSHLRDIPEIEFLCMSAARACGMDVAKTGLLSSPTPVLRVERFDRRARTEASALEVERIHQEDLAQAFGIAPQAKYAELEGGSIHAIARFIRERCAQPAKDLKAFAQILIFAYLIGDCDAHLKNYSLLYDETGLRLAPAYDLVCITRYPRFSRNLAMRFAGERGIDDVDAATFEGLAGELGMKPAALRALAEPLADGLLDAIAASGTGAFGPVLESTPYVAEDLADDIRPRLEVVKGFCRG